MRKNFSHKQAEELGSVEGVQYVARIKSNRLLDGERLSKKWPQGYGQACGHLKQVQPEVDVIKDGKRYWVTTDLELKPG